MTSATSTLFAAKWLTIQTAGYRAPSSPGQGGGTITLPSSFLNGFVKSRIYGISINAVDVADATIAIGDSRGVDWTDVASSPSAPGTTFSMVIKAGSNPGIYIPFAGSRGIELVSRRFVSNAALANRLTYNPATLRLSLAAFFTTYVWDTGDLYSFEASAGPGFAPVFARVGSKIDNDTIQLLDPLPVGSVSDVSGCLIYGGGPTVKISNTNTKGTLYYSYPPHEVNDLKSGKSMFVNTITAKTPTDGQGAGTTTLAPVPPYGTGRQGVRLYSFLVLTADAAVVRNLRIGRADGTQLGTDIAIPSSATRVPPYEVPLGPPDGGRDLFSATEGTFTCWTDNAALTGIVFYEIDDAR